MVLLWIAALAPALAAPGPPPLPILSPTALTGDAGDGRAYLRWNPQLEDPRVIGWRVLQLEPDGKTLTPDMLTEPALVVRGLANGTRYVFAVAGVVADGSSTPRSNSVAVTPRETGSAKIVSSGQNAARILFPDGQELAYDSYRPTDWKTRDGEHLIYPEPFGNGLDIGEFDERGLPRVIPPAGPEGRAHPYLTQPMTQTLDAGSNDARFVWRAPEIDGDRVTFHYWLPLIAMGYRSWTHVLVWETWWPIERDRHGCRYHGLARLVEVEMPSVLKYGYQVMLNNGFGPGGSRKGVVSYSTGFREPGREVIDYSGDRNRRVIFQSPKLPRAGYGYHPNGDCLQASPLIFYDWGRGSLTISARSLYYHCANASSSYIEQGADGVWPNLAWDLALAGKRVAVDTVEYLHTADVTRPLPQRFIDARFEVYGDVSRRMGVQDRVGAVAMDAPHSQIQREGGPIAFAETYAKKLAGTGIDVVAMYHDIWHAVPITVDDAYRFDETHDSNPSLKAMCDRLKAAGLHPGFWFRPEFTKTSLPNALSERIPTAETYYGYDMAKYPDVVALLKARGIPLFRQNTHWVRKRRDGSWPYDTPYQWVPMSLATEWWDRIAWPALWMSAKLGFESVLVDGGFGGFQGVDYTPIQNGKADGAVACQPYWWRMWRSMNFAGIRMFGECTVGWKGGSVVAGGEGDEHYQWMFTLGWYIGSQRALQTPELAHRTFQLYNSNRGDAGSAAVRRFARKFYESHPAPEWIELKDLRQLDPVDLAEAGRIRPWTWTDVVWHFEDGSRAVYPAYEKIDWQAE